MHIKRVFQVLSRTLVFALKPLSPLEQERGKKAKLHQDKILVNYSYHG